jgi:membrane protein DedA with SNARE-associated domain
MLVLALLSGATKHIGYPVLGLLVGIESMGVPVPGETALIAAGVLASQDHLSIWLVIPVAALAAIIGDNIGYLIGRHGGRRLLEREGLPLYHQRLAALKRGDKLFEDHGAKAVFFGRWIAGLRVWASWLAGGTEMHWPTFVFYNALGGISWALSIGLLAYIGGETAAHVFQEVGLYAGIAFVVGAIAVFTYIHIRRKRAERAKA